jgi:hypothetical protein
VKSSQQYFPTLRKELAIVPVLRKATVSLLAIADQYPFSKIFPNYVNLLFMIMFCIM